RAEAGRHVVGDDGDGTSQGVALRLSAVDETNHVVFARAVDGAQGRCVVDLQEVVPGRDRAVGADRSEGADAAPDLDPEFAQQHAGEGSGGDASRGLAGRGTLQDVAQVAPQVFETAREVRVTGTGSAHPALLGAPRIDRGRAHHRLPVGVVA